MDPNGVVGENFRNLRVCIVVWLVRLCDNADCSGEYASPATYACRGAAAQQQRFAIRH
jgi:hypothetical protein